MAHTPGFPACGSQRLDDKYVRGLDLPTTGTMRVWDCHDPKKPKLPWCSGFGVRLSAGGSRSFVLRYRADRVERLYTIGDFGVWSTDAARNEAFDLKRRIVAGADPLKERREVQNAPDMASLCDLFLEHAGRKRASTRRGYAVAVEKHIRPALGKKLIAAVDQEDVRKLHQKITDGGRVYAANRVVAALSAMFNLAVERKMRPDNPCRRVARNAEEKRKTYLTREQLARLTDALAEYDDQRVANAIRMLLLTGARRGEVLGARWAQFNFERNVWIKRSSETKQNREHEVPLSDAALDLLHAMREAAPAGEAFLFPGGKDGHLGDIKAHWARIQQSAGIAGVRIHDLRHSHASFLVSAGYSLEIVGAALGHSSPQTSARYAHVHDHAKREAANRIGSIMAGLVKRPGKRKPLKVVDGGKR
jgi:integrase